MKKGLQPQNKKAKVAPPPPPPLLVDVQLFANTRTLPLDPEDFDGFWRGACVVIACPERPWLVGKHMAVELKNVVAHAPYFTFRLPLSLSGAGGAPIFETA